MCFCPHMLQPIIFCLVPPAWPNPHPHLFSGRYLWWQMNASPHFPPFLSPQFKKLQCVTRLGLAGRATQGVQELNMGAGCEELLPVSYLPLTETRNINLSLSNWASSQTDIREHVEYFILAFQSIASSALHTDQRDVWPDAVWGVTILH